MKSTTEKSYSFSNFSMVLYILELSKWLDHFPNYKTNAKVIMHKVYDFQEFPTDDIAHRIFSTYKSPN